jgi:hypothetical protein
VAAGQQAGWHESIAVGGGADGFAVTGGVVGQGVTGVVQGPRDAGERVRSVGQAGAVLQDACS